MTLPMTCPASTDARAIAIVRKRAMIPAVMSIATEIAVPGAAAGDGDQQDPGHDVGDVRLAAVTGRPAPARRRPPSPAPSVPPSTYTNSSRTTTGITAMKNVSDG